MRQEQRRRLEAAVIDAVRRRGFAATTVADLVTSAGVSKGTLYEIFGSKEGCFLATFDAIAAKALREVRAALAEAQSREVRLSAAMRCMADLVAEHPAAASLVLVDSLSVGRQGVRRRTQLGTDFEKLLGESFPSELEARIFICGVRKVIYAHLRRGEPERLADRVGDLFDWSLSYGATPLAALPEAEGSPVIPERRNDVPWSEPPGSDRSRVRLGQRERIVRAAAQVATARGFSHLTIPAISAVAGTSNQTFYEYFEGKDEAFLAAFDELARIAHWKSSTAAAVGAKDWTRRVVGYLRALLEHIAAEPLFARVAFIEIAAAGPAALDRADEVTGRFTSFLEPLGLPDGMAPPSPTVAAAIGGGLRGAIQHEVANGNVERLPAQAGILAAIALAPLRRRG